MTSTLRFEGNSFSDWLDHFKLIKYEAFLREHIGIVNLSDDLPLVYEDGEIIQLIKSKMSSLDFKRFCDASQLTSSFPPQEVSPPTPAPLPRLLVPNPSPKVVTTIPMPLPPSFSRSEHIRDLSETEYDREIMNRRELIIVIDPREPNWPSLPMVNVTKYSIILPSSVPALLEDDCTMDVPCLSTSTLVVSIQMASNPFTKGPVRAAYFARTDRVETILKKNFSTNPFVSVSTKEKYENDIKTHSAAMFLAEEFNQQLRRASSSSSSSSPTIRYVNVDLLKFPDNTFGLQEERVVGQWEKFNNFTGSVAPSPTDHGTDHSLVQTFSHWTHHISTGQLLVVDCQGVFDRTRNRFDLTDPGIHCLDVVRFRYTNLASLGMRRFFKTHRCNSYCASLGLTMPTI